MNTKISFVVTAFNPITGRRFTVSQHETETAAKKAARKATGWPDVKVNVPAETWLRVASRDRF